MAEPSGHEPLLDLDTVAELLGTTERHMRRLVAERRIPYLKIGGKLRFDPADVRAYRKRQRIAAAS